MISSKSGKIMLGSVLAGIALAHADPNAEWLTASFDPARDAWQRQEVEISPRNAGKLRLLWKTTVTIKTLGMQSFREPLVVTGIEMAKRRRTLVILAAASNEVFAFNADDGEVAWHTKLAWASSKPEELGEGEGFICTNALSATPVISPRGAAVRRLYVLTSDGYLRTLDLRDGREAAAPIQMLPLPYGKPYGLNLVNHVIYTVTGQGCGGVPNRLYAVDLETGQSLQSAIPQAGLWGTAGPAIDSHGEIFFTSGDGEYDAAAGKLSTSVQGYVNAAGTLTLKDYYSPSNHAWLTRRDLDMNVTPVIFPFEGRELLVTAGKEGRYFLLDTGSLGGSDHLTPLFRSELLSNTNVNFQTEGTWGSLASWLDKGGTRWILGPTGGELAVAVPIRHGPTPHGGVLAMRVMQKHGKLALLTVWHSRDMVTAEPPVVANGVAYVLAAGEYTGQANDSTGGLFSARERIERSVAARLYALDALTGKELYSSANIVKSFQHQAGPALANGRLYFGTFDGNVYCFGIPRKD